MKVSYCTTCKGRLHHLQQTLPKNLEAERNNPDVEFVVLDYTSQDGLGDWIKEHYSNEITSGRIRYARYDDGHHFKMAHAKNMAHRVATGDILCNLDADNIIAPGFSNYLKSEFTKDPHTLVTRIRLSIGDYWSTLFKKRKGVLGLGGRIAISKQDFNELGGYNEEYSGWSPDDFDFAKRAVEKGLREVMLLDEQAGTVLSHSHEERVKNLAPKDATYSLTRLSRSKIGIITGDFRQLFSHPEPLANSGGDVGCGNVYINFSETPTAITPLERPATKDTKSSKRSIRGNSL